MTKWPYGVLIPIKYKMDMKLLTCFGLLTLFFFSHNLNAQEDLRKVTITVYDDETSEPLIGVNVRDITRDKIYATDINGRVQVFIGIMPSKIEFTYIGYETQQVLVTNVKSRIRVSIKSAITQLGEVVISSERPDQNVASTDLGKNLMQIETIRELPPLAGEVDIIKSMVLLPGVSSVGEASSGLNVRGGGFDQNLILLGGGVVYNPSHLFGFFSSINPSFIDNVTLYKGTIPAKFGGRASSVLDIGYVNGEYDKWIGEVGLGIVSSKATIKGPILKNKLSLALGGRISYVNWLLSLVDDVNLRNSATNFRDLNAKLDYRLNDNNSLSYSVYQSFDQFNLASDTTNQWTNFSQVVNWKHTFNDKLFFNWSAADSRYEFTILNNTGFNDFELASDIQDLSSKLDITFTPNKNNTFNIGTELKRIQINPGKLTYEDDLDENQPIDIADEQAYELAGYFYNTHEIGKKLSLSYGLRYTSYRYLGERTVYTYNEDLPRSVFNITDTTIYNDGETIQEYNNFAPRFGIRYSFNESTSLKLGVNRLIQNIQLVSNTATLSPVDIWKLSDSFVAPQRVWQYSLGLFKNFKDNNIETSIEGYYKDIENVLEYRDGADLILNRNIETELLNGIGQAYGVELFFKKKVGKWTGWASYTYSRSLRRVEGAFPETSVNNNEWYASNFDKPHDFTFVFNRNFPSKSKLSLIFTYSTGRPITFPSDKFRYFGQDIAYFDSRNESRIPDYHRLDISYTFKLSTSMKLLNGDWTLSVYNLYGRDNAYSVFFDDLPGQAPGAFQLSIINVPIPAVTYNVKF